MTHEGCSELLDVSVRTIQNWESARARIPHSAFKLMRILASGRYLAGPEWSDFQVRDDVLVTPEGHKFPAADLSWWALAIRQAEAFRSIVRQQRLAKRGAQLSETDAAPGNGAEATVAGAAAVDAGELAAVAKSLLSQVGSAPSSLPRRQARRKAPQLQSEGESTEASLGFTGSAKQILSAARMRGERGELSLTPKNRPQPPRPVRRRLAGGAQ